ncbi:phosphoribosylglycinamide synthetase, ATP-grasp (A) domain (plasmid) [Peptoclostridium acidaminophilum DSM 3953]|uniref:Phosphoribosylglycinamide synthetase, ATP-grasp (A) domain n=1 Tax=Peptoclostridium acidaminophilum DSM 3953 TaxID=1286171 RepID=W8TB92_PEPAC|nr:ATP-grasp domain-containing protein [Peptoclostridium acidaminophilum]AHM58115.1 phosphoribosylglycinamide synthetase, ATP-grasp (A) domain [Peptoclostridium acidaminophilum DSM 3953]
MNYVFVSPSFPSNFKYFAMRLHDEGVNVLGIGSDHYDSIDPELKGAMTEYYRVDKMEDYDQMLRACAYFTHRHGKIDRIESHNEYWLEQDAKLRTDFNVFGFKTADMENIKFKSRMKEAFKKAGVPVARGKVVKSMEAAMALIAEVGYPVCAKPDNGVGAANTYKLRSDEDLAHFFETKPSTEYIMEEFIEGEIHTFDGLVDREGEPVFMSSFVFDKGVMETVNEDLDMFYYSQREIPEDLKAYGLSALKAFGLRERFFHIEFFRQKDGRLVGLEINVRPPGGLSMDMFNFASDSDLYRQYARLVAGKELEMNTQRAYYCAYVGIKERSNILHSHSVEESLNAYGNITVHHGSIASIFAAAIGDYAFILRSPELEPLKEAARFIMQRD